MFKGAEPQSQHQEDELGFAAGDSDLEEAWLKLEEAIGRIPCETKAPNQNSNQRREDPRNNGGLTFGTTFGRSIEKLFNNSWRAGDWGRRESGFGYPNQPYWARSASPHEPRKSEGKGGELGDCLGFPHRRQPLDPSPV